MVWVCFDEKKLALRCPLLAPRYEKSWPLLGPPPAKKLALLPKKAGP